MFGFTVSYSFYNTREIVGEVSWINNTHYSGLFGLMKLQMPYVLPPSIHQVSYATTVHTPG